MFPRTMNDTDHHTSLEMVQWVFITFAEDDMILQSHSKHEHVQNLSYMAFIGHSSSDM